MEKMNVQPDFSCGLRKSDMRGGESGWGGEEEALVWPGFETERMGRRNVRGLCYGLSGEWALFAPIKLQVARNLICSSWLRSAKRCKLVVEKFSF